MAIKEINRRVNYYMEEGVACGPVSIGVVEAEIEVEDNGEKVYLYGEWVDMADEHMFVASKESIFDVMREYHASGSRDDSLIEKHNKMIEQAMTDDARFEPFYDELRVMIDKEREAQGYEIEDDEFDEE